MLPSSIYLGSGNVQKISLPTLTDEQVLEHRLYPLFVFWREDTGLWVSPNVSELVGNLPKPLVNPSNAFDPRSTRSLTWMTNTYPYLGFWPKHVRWTGFIFHRFAGPISALPIERSEEYGWRLVVDMRDRWRNVELALDSIAGTLVRTLRNPPPIEMREWKPPMCFGYMGAYPSRDQLEAALRRTRTAFVGLTAYISFAIALHVSEEDGSLQRYPVGIWQSWGQILLDNDISRAWVLELANSFVGDFGPGSRIGSLTNAATTIRATLFDAYVAMDVPLWINWGSAPPLHVCDRSHNLTRYRPTTAEAHYARYRSPVHPPRPSIPPNHAAFEEESPDGPLLDNGSQDTSLPQSYSLPPRDLANEQPPFPLHGSGQALNEVFSAFVARRTRELFASHENTSPELRHEWEQLDAQAAKDIEDATLEEPSVGTAMWRWDSFGHGQRRTFVPRSEWRTTWAQYRLGCERSFDPVSGHWDLGPVASLSHNSCFGFGDGEEDDDDIVAAFAGETQSLNTPSQAELPLSLPQKPRLHQYLPPTFSSVIDVVSERYFMVVVTPYTSHPLLQTPAYLEARRKHDEQPKSTTGSQKPKEPIKKKSKAKKSQDEAKEIPFVFTKLRAQDRLGYQSAEVEDLRDGIDVLLLDVYNFYISNSIRIQDGHPIILSPQLRRDLLQPSRTLRWDRQDRLHLLGVWQDSKPLHDQWFLLGVESSVTIVQSLRRNEGLMATMRYFIEKGIPFHTLKPVRYEPEAVSRSLSKPQWLGVVSATKPFDRDDYRAYEDELVRLLANPAIGRKAVMAGGVLWRLAKDHVPWKVLKNGPAQDTKIHGKSYGTFHGRFLVDDLLSHDEELMLLGTYQGDPADQLPDRRVSWWPSQETWNASPMNYGYWTPDCEHWFQQRLKGIDFGKATPMTSSKWRDVLRARGRAAVTRSIRTALEKLAADFLLDNTGQYWIGS